MIPSPLLVVTDRHGSSRPLVETVQAVLEGGARWIWFRDKDLRPSARRELAQALLPIVRDAGGFLTIGGDAALAAEIGADGVHLGGGEWAPSNPSPHPEVPAPGGLEGALQIAQRSLEPSFEATASQWHLRTRGRVGGSRLLGFSAHSLSDIHAATAQCADYATLSPIFSTSSKPGYGPPLGLEALRAASRTALPILALGGIGPDEAAACRAAGAAGIAVMGALMGAKDPGRETRALLDALHS